jgi:hypothetical protein
MHVIEALVGHLVVLSCCTFVVTDKEKVLAFGNSECNELGVNNAAFGINKNDNKENVKVKRILQQNIIKFY